MSREATGEVRPTLVAAASARTLGGALEYADGLVGGDFVGQCRGRPRSLEHPAETIRARLRRATSRRADRYTAGPNKDAPGVHWFRRSFVALSLGSAGSTRTTFASEPGTSPTGCCGTARLQRSLQTSGSVG